jgi:hypothetical protein
LLQEAGLSPRGLGSAINRLAGQGTVSPTAPYHWVAKGGVPRNPVPAIVARVLTTRLNREVLVAEIWPDVVGIDGGAGVMPATEGLDGPWSLSATLEVAADWLTGGLLDRRRFMQVSGAALAQALAPYLGSVDAVASISPSSFDSSDALVNEIQGMIPRLQVLDDEQGGLAGLDYVGAQLRSVMLVLNNGTHSRDVTRQLLLATADLAQLAGWKALDAGRHGLAQRYLLTGLRAARDAGYRPMEAHILADLAFQAASTGQPADGIELGQAADSVARRATAGVQASVLSRLAFAQAAAGQPSRAERTWLDARETITNKGTAVEPEWMYYLTDNHLDCQAGYSMILAGLREDDRRTSRALMRKGAALLRTGAYDVPIGDPSQRRALYEGAWLARGYTASGNLEEAAAVVEIVLPRLDEVQSPRSVAVLNEVAADMRRRTRNNRVADVLPELETALARQPLLAA